VAFHVEVMMENDKKSYYGKETDMIRMVELVKDTTGLRVQLLPNGAAHICSLLKVKYL